MSVFRAIADPIRRAVLAMLAEQSLPAGTIACAFPVSEQAISRHLRVLREAGLIAVRFDRTHRIYSFNRAALRPLSQWLTSLDSFSVDQDDLKELIG